MSSNFPGIATTFWWVSVFFQGKFNFVVGFSYSRPERRWLKCFFSPNEILSSTPIEPRERVFNLHVFFLSLPLKISLCFMVFVWNVFKRSVVSLCYFTEMAGEILPSHLLTINFLTQTPLDHFRLDLNCFMDPLEIEPDWWSGSRWVQEPMDGSLFPFCGTGT